ncbi:ribosome biogenesis factor YjgA [Desulfofustis glycolicus]|uniref:Ribosome-associated protein n=1 Tax=Desulfofustis glycolicus DSM 9705 TaxID=1121409 RepID=A0A1M5Y2Q2_9BACT|nr:ribosome biogenesis factor YjgA [Desulfofustis glycolicus]MCB2214857.1 DUF615 domain-containing protein [Desulfobulbaceae bacterium]SHI06375.1 ribosome-associated protein [Desulfofustis glycolicus DSM 9705]
MDQVSRSEKKRQFKQVEMAARECAALSDAELGRIGVSDEVRHALSLCRTTKGGALKRQIKFVAKLLRQEDVASVLHFLKQKKGSKLEEERLFHDAEHWRDLVINEAIESLEEHRRDQQPWPVTWQSSVIDRLLERYPGLDEHDLRQAAHQYARSRNKAHYRELFRMVKAAAERQRLDETAVAGNDAASAR